MIAFILGMVLLILLFVGLTIALCIVAEDSDK